MDNNARRKKAYTIVKNIFRNEEQIRLAVIEVKSRESKNYGGGGGQSYKSDPTAGKAMRELSPVPAVKIDTWTISRPEEWLRVINLTYANTKEAERELMRRYYAGTSIAELARGDCGYEEPTLYVISRNFQALAVEIACQFGLIRVVDT